MNCQCLGKQTNNLKPEGIHLILYLYIHIKQLDMLLAVLNAGLKRIIIFSCKKITEENEIIS